MFFFYYIRYCEDIQVKEYIYIRFFEDIQVNEYIVHFYHMILF